MTPTDKPNWLKEVADQVSKEVKSWPKWMRENLTEPTQEDRERAKAFLDDIDCGGSELRPINEAWLLSRTAAEIATVRREAHQAGVLDGFDDCVDIADQSQDWGHFIELRLARRKQLEEESDGKR